MTKVLPPLAVVVENILAELESVGANPMAWFKSLLSLCVSLAALESPLPYK
jgi:hypothetical protein